MPLGDMGTATDDLPDELPTSAPASLLAEIERHMRASGWPLYPLEGAAFTFVVQSGIARWPCTLVVREDSRQVLVYSTTPFTIARAQRQVAVDWLVRTNFELAIGNFDMDLESGEVRCKTGLALGDGPIDPVTLDRLVGINLSTMDLYLPVLVAMT